LEVPTGMVSNMPIPVSVSAYTTPLSFVYSCSCGKHCSPRCPHLDFDLANERDDVVGWCDLWKTTLLVDREIRKPDDPIMLVLRTHQCAPRLPADALPGNPPPPDYRRQRTTRRKKETDTASAAEDWT